MRPLADRVLALAGMVQAAALVSDAATGVTGDEGAMQITLGSILKTEAGDVPEVYGGVRGLHLGLQRLADLLGPEHDPGDLTVLRYVLGLMQLQSKLMRRPGVQKVLEDCIARSREQLRHFDLMHGNVLANLADAYSRTAGRVEPRIMVAGDARALQNPRVINLVRSLLLGGLRSAVLWRQCGGSRWALLFLRAGLLKETRRLLKESGRYA